MALGSRGRLETAPRKREQSCFLEAGALGFLAEEGVFPFILAWSPVHLLQEGSGPPFEPPVREGVKGGGWQPRAVGRLQAWGKDLRIGQGGLRRGLFEFSQTSALPPCPPNACCPLAEGL